MHQRQSLVSHLAAESKSTFVSKTIYLSNFVTNNSLYELIEIEIDWIFLYQPINQLYFVKFSMAMAVHGSTQILQHALTPVINSAVPAVHHYSMGQGNSYGKQRVA